MGDRDDPAAFETIRRRTPVLRALDSAPTPTSELIDALDLSRSTIDRAVEELEAVGLVETRDGGHVLTPAGDLAVSEYGRYEERLDALAEAADLLATLPRDAEIPPAALCDARIVRPRRHAPQRPIQPFCDLLDAADSARLFFPAVVPTEVESCRRNVVEDDTTVELAVTDPVVERLASDFRDDLAAALDTGRLRIRRVAPSLPYSLAVADRPEGPATGLLVHADRGLRGFVGNDDSDAVAWARDRLDDCWTAGTPLDAFESA